MNWSIQSNSMCGGFLLIANPRLSFHVGAHIDGNHLNLGETESKASSNVKSADALITIFRGKCHSYAQYYHIFKDKYYAILN